MSHQKTTYPEAWELSGPLAEWVQETNDSFAETRMPWMTHIIVGNANHSDRREMVHTLLQLDFVNRSMLTLPGLTDLRHSRNIYALQAKQRVYNLPGTQELTETSYAPYTRRTHSRDEL